MQPLEELLQHLRVVTGVDPDDPGFQHPTKPIGYFYTEDEARSITKELGWPMREDSGRGWRFVVASPEPKHIVDISLIEALEKRGAVVIAGGGGGIPVVRGPKKVRRGVEAVIDKDSASALLASQLQVETLIISTDAEYVYLNYKINDNVAFGFGMNSPSAREILSRSCIAVRPAAWMSCRSGSEILPSGRTGTTRESVSFFQTETCSTSSGPMT